MKALIDLNVWIDIAARPKSFPDSVAAFLRCQELGIRPCLALSGYTTLHIVVGKLLGTVAATEYLRSLRRSGTNFLTFGPDEVAFVERTIISDFEDRCQIACALSSECEIILTRDVKDFRNSPIEVLTPTQFLKRFSHKLNK